MPDLPITLFYAGALALVYLVLSVRVVQGRHEADVSLGDGGSAMLTRRIRAHANFAEYVPLLVILLALLEAGGAAGFFLHLLGGSLLLGRLAHGYALAFHDNFPPGRMLGALLTFLNLLLAGLGALWLALGAG